MNDKSIEKVNLGMQIHEACTFIHLSTIAIKDVIATKPVDEAILEVERAKLHSLRLGRSALEGKLDRLKSKGSCLPSYTWTCVGV